MGGGGGGNKSDQSAPSFFTNLIHKFKELLGFVERRSVISDGCQESRPLPFDVINLVTDSPRIKMLLLDHDVSSGGELFDLCFDSGSGGFERFECVAHHSNRTQTASVVAVTLSQLTMEFVQLCVDLKTPP